MQTKLPLELREEIYLSLFDRDIPRAVPQTEDARDTQRLNSRVNASEVFHNEYIFDEEVMGPVTGQEIQETCLRRTPIYFRGCARFPDVHQLLDYQLPSGRYVRDIIRHLRVYLRFEHFQDDVAAAYRSAQPAILPINSLFTEGQLELEMYKICLNLNGLKQLPFQSHKIKLEICIFYESERYRNTGNDIRVRYNLFEAVKPAYYRARNAGANVSVHWEDFAERGNEGRMDATELYDADAEAWIHVRTVRPQCIETHRLMII